MVAPSKPGYNMAVADLARFDITPLEAARIMAGTTQGQSPTGANVAAAPDPVITLLAQLVKTQRRNNTVYGPLGWSLAAWAKLQIFTQNALRGYLIIQNVGSGDLLVLFEGGPVSAQDLSSAGGQTQLTTEQTRAIRIVAGGYYEPQVAPSNPITIFTLGTASNGVAIEGS